MLGTHFCPKKIRCLIRIPLPSLVTTAGNAASAAIRRSWGRRLSSTAAPSLLWGVAPKGFIGTEVAYAPEMFVPVMMAKTIEPGSTWIDKRDSNNLFTVGRLKPGVSFAQAKAALETLIAKLAQDYPENVGRGIRLGKPGLFIPDIENSVFAFTGVLAGVGALVILLRVREPCQSAARARDGTATGNCRPPCGRRKPATSRQTTAH